MSNFRTEITCSFPQLNFNYHTPLVFLGSCFAQNISAITAQNKLPSYTNPFGILYHPIAIANALQVLLKPTLFTPADLFVNTNEQWASWAHHGCFSHSDQQICLQQINKAITQGHQAINKASALIITLGTAFAWQHKQTNQIVGNCHKAPHETFNTQLSNIDEMVAALQTSLQNWLQANPSLKIVLTVSPVRHWRHGAVINAHSKALLIAAAHKLCQQINTTTNRETAVYFPAYEIMMDDLRDYRFYASDMLHPSETAIQYIWQQFYTACFNVAQCTPIMQAVEAITTAAQHRPRTAKSNAHQIFCQQQLKKIAILQTQYPALNFEAEIAHFNQFLD